MGNRISYCLLAAIFVLALADASQAQPVLGLGGKAKQTD